VGCCTGIAKNRGLKVLKAILALNPQMGWRLRRCGRLFGFSWPSCQGIRLPVGRRGVDHRVHPRSRGRGCDSGTSGEGEGSIPGCESLWLIDTFRFRSTNVILDWSQ